MPQPPKIVLTGGGSGGHITPLLSLAHELKQLAPESQITYIGHQGDRFDNLQESSPDFDFVSFINAGKFRRYHGESFISHLVDLKTLILNTRDFFRFITSIGKALRILRKTKPEVVFSKGGFVSVPVGVAAKLLRVPIVTHDSDVQPGLANRIIGRWAKINATGMAAHYYSYPKKRIRYVGVPIPPQIQELSKLSDAVLKRSVGLPGSSLVLLICGGGNGSKRLNDLVLAAAPELLSGHHNLYILHVAGPLNEKDVRQGYANVLNPTDHNRVQVFGFTKNFSKLAAASDIILSRAGATSIAEFALLGRACIIMPSPFLTGGHQLKNARELSEKDAAVIVGEETDADEFIALANELLSNSDRRRQLAQNLKSFAKPDAAHDLAKIILEAAQRTSFSR